MHKAMTGSRSTKSTVLRRSLATSAIGILSTVSLLGCGASKSADSKADGPTSEDSAATTSESPGSGDETTTSSAKAPQPDVALTAMPTGPGTAIGLLGVGGGDQSACIYLEFVDGSRGSLLITSDFQLITSGSSADEVSELRSRDGLIARTGDAVEVTAGRVVSESLPECTGLTSATIRADDLKPAS